MRVPRPIDISPPVSARSEVWPGDTAYSSRRVMDKAEGCSCNVTTITTTVHVGAHVDAPLHFSEGGADAAGVDLDACIGPARVVRMPRRGAITPQDLETLDLAGVDRLLLHTRKAGAPARFADGFAYLEPEAARRLAARGLRLVGIDTYSVDHPDSKTLESHHALLEGGCVILEGLALSGVAPGDYELVALPLRLVGADASPVRAILRELPRVGAKRGLPRRVRRAQRDADHEDPNPPDDADEAGDTMAASPEDTMREDYLLTTLELHDGDAVRVTLDAPANVMLVDDANLAGYAGGRDFGYVGGWTSRSPVSLVPPRPGRWNVLIDNGDAPTAVSAAITVVKG